MRLWFIGAFLGWGLLIVAPYLARASSALVQESTGEIVSGTSFTLSFRANVGQGDEVTVFAACAGHTNTLSLNGLNGAAWKRIESDPSPTDPNSPVADMWLALAPSAAGSEITVNAGATDNCAAHAAEWAVTSGVKDTGDAVDRYSGSFGSYGGPQTAQANDLVVMDVAWRGNATITGAPEGTTGPLSLYIPMTTVSVGSALNIQPYYFLTWSTGSFPAVNGSFSVSADWSTLQVALESVGTNATPTPAAPCSGAIANAAAPYARAGWGPLQR